MLPPRQKSAVIQASMRAKQLERPYMLVCADIPRRSILLYEGTAALPIVVGSYVFMPRQYIAMYLRQRGFPYSYFDVGEIQRSGDPNVLMWLVGKDIDQIKPHDFDRTFSRIFSVEVGTRVESWEELINGPNGNSTEVETLKRLAPNGRPPVVKIRFKGGNSYIRTDGLPYPYRELPPELWDL